MDTILNITIAILLSIIDITIIDFYLKRKFLIKEYINTRLYFLIELFFFIFVNSDIFSSYFINAFFLLLALLIINHKYIIDNIKRLQFIFLFFVLNFITKLIISFLFAWLFDSVIVVRIFNWFLSYKMLSQLSFRYIEFIIIMFLLNKKTSEKITLHHFKIISIIFSIYSCVAIVVNNDRLFYFKDIGRTFIFIMIVYNIALIMFDRYHRKTEDIEKELMITKQNIALESQYIKEVGDKNKQMREFRHDIKNRALIINGLIQSGATEDATKEIEKILGETTTLEMNTYVNNVYVDTVIDNKVNLIKSKGFEFQQTFGLINMGNIDAYDMALALALAMDNAIEAVANIKNGPKKISLHIHTHKTYIIITLSNTIQPGTKVSFVETSKIHHIENHGFGVKKIKSIAERYQGTAKYEVKDSQVTLKLLMKI